MQAMLYVACLFPFLKNVLYDLFKVRCASFQASCQHLILIQLQKNELLFSKSIFIKRKQILERETNMDNIGTFKVIEIKQSVFENNAKRADLLRGKLKKDKIFLLNLMSSPGSGKTTTLIRTIEKLKGKLRIGVMEADIDSDVDARMISRTGTKTIQLHTGGMCHLDAEMTRQGLEELDTTDLDLVVLENIGNLVCPAEFDTGAVKNAMILSVPEGDDKPLKYPLMFSVVDILLINKIDVLDHFNFDLELVTKRAKKLNPNIEIIPISAKTGHGVDIFSNWLQGQIESWQQ
jgi:hydrogenase nickel incorporation protein HypB